MLVIIDDVWQIEHFNSLKVGGSNCDYLITTRSPRLASEIAGADAIAVDELTDTDGFELLAQLAPRVAEADLDATYRLAQCVGGLPLALRIMGNYLRMEAMSGQVRRIQTALTALFEAEAQLRLEQASESIEWRPAVSPNTRVSLQSVIDVSVQQLSQRQSASQDAIRALQLL